ncbi:MAG: DNA-protecting protein DprA [Acidimicrobiia bacterium]|nr:DNA-protecting protein DprA [Acidimicrobiia bacterium]
MSPPSLPGAAWLTALAGLPKMGPARLLAISLVYEPAEAWQAVATGQVLRRPELVERMGPSPQVVAEGWQRAAARVDVEATWADHADISVAARGDAAYPAALVDDLEPPAVVFTRGAPVLDGTPRVAVVGTRRCTRYGFDVAGELGRELAAAGMQVVSGLALGIDGAAHQGALDAAAAPPVAVVGSGVDVVYPQRHRRLWEQIAAAGSILSECPLGTPPEAWRFPARNRIIAALADAVVVVESAGSGGSMYTVEEALARDRPVLAVPGSVQSRASAGTNKLLAEGAGVVRDANDVLAAMGLPQRPRRRARKDAAPRAGPAGAVLRALRAGPGTLDSLTSATGLALGPLSVAVAELEAAGWVSRHGLWLERTKPAR